MALLLVAAIFPVMMNAYLVALAMMLISLCGCDGAQRNDCRGDSEDDLLHYEILESVLGY